MSRTIQFFGWHVPESSKGVLKCELILTYQVLGQWKAFQVRDEIEMRIGCEDGTIVPKRNRGDC